MHLPYGDFDDDELPAGASTALRHALHHARTREIHLGRLHPAAAASRPRRPVHEVDDDSVVISPFHSYREVA
jgi:hypothetical protein